MAEALVAREALADVLAALSRVRTLRFEARSQAGTGWDGVGTGEVRVSSPQPGVVLFEEAGVWQAERPGAAGVAFRNVFRWTAVGERLRLEHLRQGPDHPVFLFDLAWAGEGSWHTVQPHLCAADVYAAQLHCEADAISVAWTIRGPRKDEAIRYRYGAAT
ncbi:MAG: hypothetical protein KF871_18190 [Hydrogenophaga sp.]|uniref:DUF6314 family protein n=1 Tax=Hydrogenophaga sp. TaxID=1904254 RepID=UPI001D5B1B56|nr:DUF6314 family protein [Hydrogenophaga sp.]MBX3611831.1 hypothetical protein [Hydrogenophaga sp.]